MDFAHASHREAYDLVDAYMNQLFAGRFMRNNDVPMFAISHGPVDAMISVAPHGENSVVTVLAWVVRGAEPSEDLWRFLLHENLHFVYGGFAIDDDNDIAFRCTLYGGTLDREELGFAIAAVVSVTERYADQIVSRFGGRATRSR
jgi:hypothetical protein